MQSFDDIKKFIIEQTQKYHKEHEGNIFIDGKERSADEATAFVEQMLSEIQPDLITREMKSDWAAETGEIAWDIDEVIKKIDRDYPSLPTVKLIPKRSEHHLSVFVSKLGGTPYMPKDFEYPKGKNGIFEGRPLRLLAQLNFEQLPHIENFPEKGILQFFCSDDEEESMYGLDYENPISQNGFRVIYHENIITDESQLITAENLPQFSDEYGIFPFKDEFALEAEVTECPITFEDYRFFDSVMKYCGEICGKELKCYLDVEKAGFGDVFEEIAEQRTYEHSCIGGYPFFTQDDPRGFKKEIEDYDILLFQCASFYDRTTRDEIMWGDMGVANFFIKPDDLKNLDFSKVAYNWDCC